MDNRLKRFLSSMLAFTLAASLSAIKNTSSAKADPISEKGKIKQQMKEEYFEELKNIVMENKQLGEQDFQRSKDPDEIIRVIVQMKQSPRAINSSVTEKKVIKYQENTKIKADKLEGSEIRQSYTNLINGFSMTIKRSEIEKLKSMKDVKSVRECRVYYPVMNSAKKLTQVYETWNKLNYKGEGMVVSIIDTGIDVNHKDMNLTENSKMKIKDIKNSKETKFTEKVPYGRNFADNNDDVKDGKGKSMHGMHVAGIVAANGNDDEVDRLEAIKGVAPEAQLLAMKVFSNNPSARGAYDDDIIAAIEDSVEQGADIINMSLGSAAGFQDPNDSMEIAIKNATDKGTLVVIAAGNDATSNTSLGWNTPPTNNVGTVDSAMLGAPGTANDALTVASYENNKITSEALSYKIRETEGKMDFFPSENSPSVKLKGNKYKLVNCGKGEEPDYDGEDVRGKIAIVEFELYKSLPANLRKIAGEKGAVGLIMYSPDGLEITGSMGENSEFIPAAWVGNTNGKKLIAGIENGIEVFFDGDTAEVESALNGDMSPFTSFGPTPNLAFKPEITAPGGNIYSTVNDNKYENMSGTSMATPHTAGAEALIMQAIKEKLPSLSGRELVEFAKKTSINTSKTLMDKHYGEGKVPYSPRRQGSGIIQIKDALENKVMLTDNNGEATVALKEIGKQAIFTLKLKNYDKEPITFDLSSEGVMSERILDDKGHYADYVIPNSSISFSKNAITVEGNSEAFVDVTINLSDDIKTENFVEGFVHFTAKDGKNPNLTIPFMGFYGGWSKLDIVDKPLWEEESLVKRTGLIWEYFFGKPLYLGANSLSANVKKDSMAISPDGDGFYDKAMPYLGMLRNAKFVKVEVVDKNDGSEKVLRDLGKSDYVRKASFEGQRGGLPIEENSWDGYLYNDLTGKYEVAKEGEYYIKITAEIDYDNAKPQVTYLPVKVDLTEPTLQIISTKEDVKDNVLTLKWIQKDEGEGAGGFVIDPYIYVNGRRQKDFKEPIKSDGEYYSCKIELPEGKANEVSIRLFDAANNLSIDAITTSSMLIFDNLKEGMYINKSKLVDKNYKITGTVSDEVSKLTINEVQANIINSKFDASIPVDEGENQISIVALDKDGKSIDSLSKKIKINVDSIEPQLTITSPVLKEGEGVISNSDKLLIKGIAKDERTPYDKLTVKAGGENATVKEDGTFEVEVPVESGHSNISVYVEDQAKNRVETQFSVGREADNTPFEVVFDNLEAFKILSQEEIKAMEDDTYIIKGHVNHRIHRFTINGKEVEINKDLTFAFPLKLEKMFNKVVVYAADANGNVYSNYAYQLWYDSKLPSISITEPIEHADGKVYTNKDVLKIKGSAYDDGAGYTLWINGNQVLSLNKYPNFGEEATKREFEYEVSVQDGSIVKVECIDSFGNEVSKDYNIVVDKEVPQVTVGGIEEGKIYNSSIKPEIKVNEENTTLNMTLDVKTYLGTEISEEGKHTLVVTATDRAGNVSEEYKVNFTIDKTAPEITVSGVEDGKVYTEGVTPEVKTNEKATITMILDEKAYDGAKIKELGNHSLVVTAIDEAGNKSEKTISFSIEVKKVDEDKPKDDEDKPSDNNNAGNNNGDNKEEAATNKEATTNTSGKTNGESKLVKTGSVININTLVVSGVLIIIIGGTLNFASKRRENQI